jgi:hypothetical protein
MSKRKKMWHTGVTPDLLHHLRIVGWIDKSANEVALAASEAHRRLVERTGADIMSISHAHAWKAELLADKEFVEKALKGHKWEVQLLTICDTIIAKAVSPEELYRQELKRKLFNILCNRTEDEDNV